MKKYITDFKVQSNERLTDRLFMLKLTPADGSPIAECKAGQFAELRVDGEPKVFLRRPISIHRIDKEKNELWLLIQRAGSGTNQLANLNNGDLLNIVYPLGNGFTLEPEKKNFLLIGGGVGVAPLLETGFALQQQGAQVTYLLGARSCADLISVAQYKNAGCVYATTEDGSIVPGLEGCDAEGRPYCQKGFATQHTI